jgi:hypothetical protein
MRKLIPSAASVFATFFAVGSALAEPVKQVEVPLGEGSPPENLPPPQSSHDPRPPVAAPMVRATGVTEQAGIGGTQAYGRAGVLELGGSAGFAAASGFTQVSLTPSIGYFVMDNVELSGLINYNMADAGGVQTSILNVLAEPSLHLPMNDQLFGFLGLGRGLSYADGPGAGFALAPRLGLNVMVGRSGVLTPAILVSYSTTDAIQTSAGTLLAVNVTYGANIGYTVMW